MNLSVQIGGIRTGHLLLALCCLIYLVWWSITFNPGRTFPSLPKYILFLGMMATGLAGGISLLKANAALPVIRSGISSPVIAIGGFIIYLVLLYLTAHFLHRQVTTELFLIVGWTVLELSILSGLYRASAFSLTLLAVLAVIIICAAVVGMVCYLAYYQMPAKAAFFDGMVPLILFGLVMVLEAILLAP